MFLSRAEMELRTPLALIQGYIETLKTGAIKNGDSLARCLEVMDKHSRKLMHVIEDINALAQLEAGVASCPCDDAFLKRCLETSIERLTPLIEVTGAVVEAHIPPGSCELKGDRMIWHLVFMKLLQEVLRGLPENARVTVRAAWEAGGCVLTIESDARILPPGPFASAGGWGEAALGLLVVKRAMELNHGSLDWQTEPGRGSRFVLSMPCMDSCKGQACRTS